MAKLSRLQIKEARAQAKQKRQEELEELREVNPEEYEKKTNKTKEKKDKLGFTRQDRYDMHDKKLEINKPKPKVTWNYSEGELVYLPGGEIGIIVNNNAVNIELSRHEHDMKKNLAKYAGKVYVVTSSGNNWHYPKTLKPVR
tara:strand:+ start:628 stop:1053 length:426 start_codon:yes stop_codon:yes gene_type:complete